MAFERWQRRPITAADTEIAEWPLDEYATLVPRPSVGSWDSAAAFERVRDRILDLRLFPPQSIVLHADTTDGRAALGATVVQHLFLGPLGLESGVRITQLEDGWDAGSRHVSLTWATLEGHPERGVETFSASLGADGAVRLGIRARSQPGLLMVRLVSPFARRLQVRLAHRSLALLSATAAHPRGVARARGGG
ncbi:hypothetical protein BH24CHL8_BH24CHL8_09260 [soil metagenome]